MNGRDKSRSRRHGTRNKRLVVVLVMVVLVAGATALWWSRRDSVDPTALFARAEQQFADGAYAGAIIDLKNVVVAEGSKREARVLLGRAYLKAGNPAGALKEFRKARELGASDPELALGLTRALILTGKFDDAATEIALAGDTAGTDWLVLRGMLDLAQQRLEDARKTFTDILAATPAHVEAQRGLIQVELAAGNLPAARSALERLLENTDDDAALWVLKGELDLEENNATAAREAFTRARALAPKDPLAILGMARALLVAGEPDQAANQLDQLGNTAEEDPRANFVRAQVAEAKGDKNAALIRLRKVLQIAPMHRESLVMAAKLHFGLGEFSRAQDYVGRMLEIEPNNEAARRMLGAIQLASGRLDGLNEIDAAANPAVLQDPGMLALLGTAYLKYGRFEDSAKSLERAAELAPESLPIRTQLALSKLSTGDADGAIADLERILAEDPNFVQADIMLALAHLQQKRPEQAAAVARTLVTKQPDDALAHNVLGYVAEASGDKTTAKAAYDAALARDAAFHPARINLARLAVQDGDMVTAKARFDEIIARDPFHAFALMGLAALALKDNDLDEVERLWLLAREHNPDAVAPRLLLARHYRAKNNLNMAETMIEEAYALAPFATQVQAEYATLKLQAAKYSEALAAAQALNARDPDGVASLELLARIYNQLGDEAALTAALQRIATVAPDAVVAQQLLGRLAIRRKDYAAAQTIIDGLLTKPEHAAAGHELAGDLLSAREDRKGALEAYMRAHATAPDTGNLLKLDRAERDLGVGSGERLAQWLESHPNDLQARLVHATYLQQAGAGDAAIPQYEQMLAAQGDNPVVLNNLAWLYHEADDERALELARRAHEMAPKLPEIMDTYGWILFSRGQREQGLELLEKAATEAPKNPDIAFHVASALHASGQVARARAKLEALLEAHATFPLRAEAEALLTQLQQ